MEFSKNDTKAIKGIAIIMMLIHHCFLSGRYENYNIVFLPFSETFTVKIATFFKICVAIFVFLSAYGITKKTNEISKNKSKNNIKTSILNRYLSLMAGFWFIFIISQIFCFIMDKRQLLVYKSNSKTNFILYFITDGLGLANLFGKPTLNGTWWYMSLAIFLIAIVPLFIKLYKKYGFIVTSAILVFITHIFEINNTNMTKWLFMALLGVVSADKNILVKLKEYKILKNNYLNKTVKFILSTIIVVILVIIRNKATGTFNELRDGLIPFFIIYYCYEFILPIKYLNNILVFLGKHSANIFLTHTFIRQYYFGDFIYSFKYPLLIVLVLLVISLFLSIIIEFLKKYIGYNKLIDKIRKRIVYKTSE